MKSSEEDFLLENYNFQLAEERIAQFPCQKRGSSRMLVMPRHPDGQQEMDTSFSRLPDFLPEGALLVANNCRVLPARMFGTRQSGGKVEMLLLTPLPLIAVYPISSPPLPIAPAGGPYYCADVECLLRPSAKIGVGDTLFFNDRLMGIVKEKGDFGRHMVRFFFSGELEEIFKINGTLPLPPYIHRQPESSDMERYQTCYARKTGAVAAPTAGLHFTRDMRQQLLEKGFQWLEVTLYVGYGTFSPVRETDIRNHRMHAEYVEIDSISAEAIKAAKKEGRPVIAIGTTSLRALEGVAEKCGEICEFRGWTDIFLYPGSQFNVVDGLLTNFHLPQSSLLMLVSAFAGRSRMLAAYARAIELGYNFFSYGDAMLITPSRAGEDF